MKIEIREVLTKQDLWTWVRFPNQLYKDNEFFVPFLENDELNTFSSSIEKNPAYEFCETKLFLAYKKGIEVDLSKNNDINDLFSKKKLMIFAKLDRSRVL